jgi:diphthine synthase
MLTFVGLGLYDERSVTVAGRDAVRAADRVFAEFYTSRLVGADVADLEAYHDVTIEVRNRDGVEGDPGPIVDAGAAGDAVFLTAGDPMMSTTHVDLRLRAADRGVETRLVHGPTAAAAASGLTGLQNYRFGKATTLPFPAAHGGEGVPASVVETLDANRERDLHTLVYLDIKVGERRVGDGETDRYMTAAEAASLLETHYGDTLAVAVARAGSPDPVVAADRLSALADREFGPPLHLLVVPGALHHLEAEALVEFGDAPPSLVAERRV